MGNMAGTKGARVDNPTLMRPEDTRSPDGQVFILDADDLDLLLGALRNQGYDVIGPRLAGGAIVYDPIRSAADLPRGWKDEQSGGRYRLNRRSDQAYFGYVVGPRSWKHFLLPSKERLVTAQVREGGGLSFQEEPLPKERLAFVGVRACEIAAMEVQDRIFRHGTLHDERYAQRRQNVLIVAVQCTEPAATCFCTSVGTGPMAGYGYDLALTELIDAQQHCFLVECGSQDGRALLASLPLRRAQPEERALGKQRVEQAARQITRQLPTVGLRDLLYRNLESPRWELVADRCLACGNCTMVCPTCFCTTVEEVADLQGERAERWRYWDSCFTHEFSHLAGGAVRHSIRARYRQWITHKLATWFDQFGVCGCVGCGRCITWCPVGIDITEEVNALREAETCEA